MLISNCLSEKAIDSYIKSIAKKLNIDPVLIINRLLSDEDIEDIKNNQLPLYSLDLHIKCWIDKGISDYRNGNTEPLIKKNDSGSLIKPVNKVLPVKKNYKKIVPEIPACNMKPTLHKKWKYNKPFYF